MVQMMRLSVFLTGDITLLSADIYLIRRSREWDERAGL